MMSKAIRVITVLIMLSSCGKKEPYNGKLFELKTQQETGITFTNTHQETLFWNYFVYPYIYMGGGVAVGDLNNDGLQDIYLVGNMTPNELYLNKGGMKFENITLKAGLRGDQRWMTGVTMADVNNDGWLDIYISVSGKYEERPENMANLLYINNQDQTFTEMSADYGLNYPFNTIQSTFFDFDKDGDLDVYLLNNPVEAFDQSLYAYQVLTREKRDQHTDRLYRNDGGFFTDVTDQAGIRNFGMGLGIVAGDVNNDGWEDLYISNDFNVPDHFFINNGDGTFTNKIDEAFAHTSYFGMGVDMSDFNNDGWQDIAQVDMMADDNRRKKANMSSMNPDEFWKTVDYGFGYQYMINTLQLNNGNETFSEIAYMADFAETDWSWATLFVDLDNNGWKDIFVTNGIPRDVRNSDIQKDLEEKWNKVPAPEAFAMIDKMPSEKIPNYAFRNDGSLQLKKYANEWGLDFAGFSNGAAYADLDNDGDLDLVVNNLDTVSMIFENHASEMPGANYLRLQLLGQEDNKFGLGSIVTIHYREPDSLGNTVSNMQRQHLTLTRGFQSSVEPFVHFGIKDTDLVDRVEIKWPNGKRQVLEQVAVNQVLLIDQENARQTPAEMEGENQLFEDITRISGVDFKHQENEFNDFEKEILLPHKMSQFGPALATGDLNGDGWEDFYVGGAKGQIGEVFVQTPEGKFDRWQQNVFSGDRESEDLGALFFDADQDGDLDLYVVSGGNEFQADQGPLQDRLYVNLGEGKLAKATGSLPNMPASGLVVTSGDFNGDQRPDLFVGGRVVPGKYPYPARSYLLKNTGGIDLKVKFEDVTKTVAPDLVNPGLVTDALWTDFNNDQQPDLVVTGEWMPVLFLQNKKGVFSNITDAQLAEENVGWWFSLAQGDFDKDGDLDFIGGNLGLNYKYHTSRGNPFEIYADDFDENNTIDIVLSYFEDTTFYPVRGRECSSQQMPFIKKKFPNYALFSEADIYDIYGKDRLQQSLNYKATNFASCYIENLGNGKFDFRELPEKAQIASINGMLVEDFDADGNLDLLTSGNLYVSEVETPRSDASIGLYLKGDGTGNFTPVSVRESGYYTPGDVKNLRILPSKTGKLILIAKNDDHLQVIRWQNPAEGKQVALIH